MSKKTKQHTAEDSPRKNPLSLFFMFIGGIQMFIGGGMMYASSGAQPSGPPWLRTAAMIVLVIGGICIYLSTLPNRASYRMG